MALPKSQPSTLGSDLDFPAQISAVVFRISELIEFPKLVAIDGMSDEAPKVASYRKYDWNTGRLGDFAGTQPSDVVIVEGVYMSRPKFRDLFDLVVWIETPQPLVRGDIVVTGTAPDP